MRIVLVNWNRIWDGTRIGGGVGGYLMGLARTLRDQGHDIITLHAGQEAVPRVDPRTLRPGPGKPEIRRHLDWEGIRCFELVNSPVLAPALFQSREPLGEIASPELEAELERFAQLLQPDIIHFHNIEGLTASAIHALRRAGPAKLLFSIHNYHTICPTVYLMKHGIIPCHDFESGKACETCVQGPGVSRDPAPEWFRRWTGAMQRLNVPVGPPLMPTINGELPGAYQPVTDPTSVTAPAPLQGTDIRGIFQRPGGPMIDEFAISRDPASNDLQPLSGTGPGTTSTPYGERRAAMIDMLNGCDRVLAVSTFVQRRMQTLGVRASVLKTMTIGTVAGHAATPATDAAPRTTTPVAPNAPNSPNSGRIRLCFLGFNHIYKGLHVLLDAIDALPAELAARIDLSLFVGEIWRTGARLTRTQQRIHSLTTRDGYEPAELSGLLHGVDLGIVPSIWWDNGPQTVLEFHAHGIPVLGSNIGGIPDFVKDGVNGRLFRANDRADLVAKLSDLIRSPDTLTTLRQGVTPPKSMHAHAQELIAEYISLGARA